MENRNPNTLQPSYKGEYNVAIRNTQYATLSLWGNKSRPILYKLHQVYIACMTISAYTSSGIFLIMPIVTLLIKSEFKGGNDLRTLFGLHDGLAC